MIVLKILTTLDKRLCSDLHPFYRWESEFRSHGIKIKTYFDYADSGLKNSDFLIIHSRYLKKIFKKEEELISCLVELKKSVRKLIWFDATDSSGTMDFVVIPYVDLFLKKQVLKDFDYYTGEQGNNNVRIWLDPSVDQVHFTPCPKDMVHKIAVGWNLSYFDYRPYNSRIKLFVSNLLGYWFYPNHYYNVERERPLDMTFRGTMNYGKQDLISTQRNKVLSMIKTLNLNIAHGKMIPRLEYLKELGNSKISVSPFGWGEICYRDFESFICGAVLIKPSMEHVTTFPNIFIENVTYIPVNWDLSDFPEKATEIIENYDLYKNIATEGQKRYLDINNDSERFINHIKEIIFNT